VDDAAGSHEMRSAANLQGTDQPSQGSLSFCLSSFETANNTCEAKLKQSKAMLTMHLADSTQVRRPCIYFVMPVADSASPEVTTHLASVDRPKYESETPDAYLRPPSASALRIIHTQTILR
jgi:hypothetical protein